MKPFYTNVLVVSDMSELLRLFREGAQASVFRIAGNKHTLLINRYGEPLFAAFPEHVCARVYAAAARIESYQETSWHLGAQMLLAIGTLSHAWVRHHAKRLFA